MRRIGPIEDRDPALIPRLHHHVAPGDRDERPVVRDTILVRGLRRQHLVVALERHPAIVERENGVGAPLRLVEVPALRLSTTAPLVGEEQLGAVVVERRRMPIGKIRVRHRADASRMRRVPNVEQQSVAAARAARETNGRIDSDVMALVGTGPLPGDVEHAVDDCLRVVAQRLTVGRGRRASRRATARLDDAVEQRGREARWQHALRAKEVDDVTPMGPRAVRNARGLGDVLLRLAMLRRRREGIEDPWRAHDRGLLRRGERHLDDFDPEQRAVGVRIG